MLLRTPRRDIPFFCPGENKVCADEYNFCPCKNDMPSVRAEIITYNGINNS